MGVWIVSPTSPLLLPEFKEFSTTRETGDPWSSAVKLHGDGGGVRDTMRRRGNDRYLLPTSLNSRRRLHASPVVEMARSSKSGLSMSGKGGRGPGRFP